MVDVVGMAVFQPVDDLEEDGFDAGRVAGVCSVIVDQVVETTAGAVIEQRCSIVAELDVLVQGDDVGMVGQEIV